MCYLCVHLLVGFSTGEHDFSFPMYHARSCYSQFISNTLFFFFFLETSSSQTPLPMFRNTETLLLDVVVGLASARRVKLGFVGLASAMRINWNLKRIRKRPTSARQIWKFCTLQFERTIRCQFPAMLSLFKPCLLWPGLHCVCCSSPWMGYIIQVIRPSGYGKRLLLLVAINDPHH